MIPNLQTVNTWAWTTPGSRPNSCLTEAFKLVTFFDEVYLPVKEPGPTGMPEQYSYQYIGYTFDEIASIYQTLYGGNYLVEDFTDPLTAATRLSNRINAIIHLNKAKYLKNIELLGFEWNPLWNVDGKEVITTNSGIQDTYNEKLTKGTTLTKTIGNTDTTTYNADTITDTVTHKGQTSEYDDKSTFDYHGSVQEPTNPSTGEEASRQYIPKDRHIIDESQQTDTHTITHTGSTSLGRSGTDTDAWTGDDQKHGGNKRTENSKVTNLRQGNIGVTKSTDLIDAARETYKWSILMDFFKDINENILVGIW